MRLTDRENEIRRDSCGDEKSPQFAMVKIFGSQEGDSFEEYIYKHFRKESEDKRYKNEEITTAPSTTIASTTVASTVTQTSSGSTVVTSTVATTTIDRESEIRIIWNELEKIPFATGFFISERHILTSSRFFIEKRGSKWYNKQDRRELNTTVCSKKNRKNLFITPHIVVFDFGLNWRDPGRVIFLNFCALQHNSSDFLTVLVAGDFKIPSKQALCLPKSRTVASIGQEGGWLGHIVREGVLDRVNMHGHSGGTLFFRHAKIQKCKSAYPENLYFCTNGVSCRNHYGAPLVVSSNRIHSVIGVTISGKCNETKPDVFHNVKAYMNDFCKYFNICNRPMTKIPLIPDKRSRSYLSIEDDYIYQEPEPEILDVLKGTRRIDNFLVFILVLWCLC